MDRILELIDYQRLITMTVEYLPRLFTAIAIFIGFLVLFRLTRRPIVAICKRADIHQTLINLLVDKLYRYVVIIVGAVMAADQLGVNVTAALAGISVVGIALGFAAQDSIANIIAGILIFWDKPFRVGDFISTEGQYGQVRNITLRTTRIRTPRNTYVVIPNKRIIDEVLENDSKQGEMRIDVPVGIAYKEDIREARKVILKALENVPGRSEKTPPDVVAQELGDSSINLLVRVWLARAESRQPAWFATVEACKIALDEAGIQIPFPHLQLFVDDIEDRAIHQLAKLRRTGDA